MQKPNTARVLPIMDKKTKKRLEVLRKKIAHLQQQLAGATQQMDDPEGVDRLRNELTAAQDEANRLRHS